MFGQKKTFLEQILINPLIILLIVAPLFMVFVTSRGAVVIIFGVDVVGLLLIVISKWPAFQKKDFFSFGPKGMSKSSRTYYFLGYALVGISLVLTAWVLTHLSFYSGR